MTRLASFATLDEVLKRGDGAAAASTATPNGVRFAGKERQQ